MSTLKRLTATAAATTLVLAGGAVSGSTAQAKPLKLKLPISGTNTMAKSGSELKLPDGAYMNLNLNINKSTIRKGVLHIPQITAHLTALGAPAVAKVNLVQTRPVRGKLSKKGFVRTNLFFKLAVPDVRIDLPLIDQVNIVEKTCRTGEIKAVLRSTNKFSLHGKMKMKADFTIPKFDGCSLINVPVLGIRNSLLTQLISGPDNKMNLKVGPVGVQ